MWDQRYSEQGFAYGTVANDFIKAQYSHIPKGGKVLCLAEGEGRNAVFLALQGYQVTAIDLSEVGLAKAQQLAEQHGVKISTQVADLADYHFAEQVWDGIVSISAHMPSALRKQAPRLCGSWTPSRISRNAGLPNDSRNVGSSFSPRPGADPVSATTP